MPPFPEEQVKILSEVLQERHGFATKTMLDLAITDVLKKTAERSARGQTFSLGKMIRGLRAMAHSPLNSDTAEDDVRYVTQHCTKALNTTSTPGSYLIPVWQADTIIALLAQASILRAAGCRIWPMSGMQKLNIPQSLGYPAFVWAAQNSQQTPSDPNIGQVAFDLKEQRALVAVPNQLLAASVPSFDTLLAALLAQGAADHEDQAFMATSNVGGAPACIYAFPGVTTINSFGGNANGGPLLYADILACMQKALEAKAKPPFCWIMSPRSWFARVLGMLDGSSRPLAIPTMATGLYPMTQYQLLGWPVYISANVSNSEAVGSGANCSHIVFVNPQYLNIAQDEGLAIAVSLERFFDQDQTAVRAISRLDFAVSPAAGCTILAGVN